MNRPRPVAKANPVQIHKASPSGPAAVLPNERAGAMRESGGIEASLAVPRLTTAVPTRGRPVGRGLLLGPSPAPAPRRLRSRDRIEDLAMKRSLLRIGQLARRASTLRFADRRWPR